MLTREWHRARKSKHRSALSWCAPGLDLDHDEEITGAALSCTRHAPATCYGAGRSTREQRRADSPPRRWSCSTTVAAVADQRVIRRLVEPLKRIGRTLDDGVPLAPHTALMSKHHLHANVGQQ